MSARRSWSTRAVLLVVLALVASTGPGVPRPAAALPLYSTRQGLPCVACHFDPQGGGARRELGFLYEKNRHDLAPEERWADIQISNKIGDALYFGTNLRQQYTYIDPVGSSDNSVSTFFPMQGALYAVFAPLPQLTAQYNRDLRQSRDAWVMVHDLPAGLWLKAGQFRVPFGLRMDDHTGAMRAGFRDALAGSFGTSGFLPYDPREVEGGIEAGVAPLSSLNATFSMALTNGGAAFAQDAQALTAKVALTEGQYIGGLSGYHNYRSTTGGRDWRASYYGGWTPMPPLTFLAEFGLGETESGAGVIRRTRGFFVETDYRLDRTVLFRGKYDYIDLDYRIDGLAQERFTLESDLTFLPFVDMKLSYRRVVPEDAADENQGLIQWHFYY
jgi:hypothetical protein